MASLVLKLGLNLLSSFNQTKEKTMKAKAIAIASTYFRAAFAAVTALYLAGETSPKALASAALAAVAGPVLKALDSNSPEFGRGSK
jgi:TPP-dependent trihydroxycyclohexane-1,2-dione (THcHDO) dehydratase